MPLRRCCVFLVVGLVAAFIAGAGCATAAEPPADLGEQPATLDNLAWMVGDWVVEQTGEGSPPDDESHQAIAVHVRWSPTRAFLIREMTIHRRDRQVAHYTQRIGHDARTKVLRSWLFDDQGSHGEAVWTQKGDTLIARSTTVLPDGREVTARTDYDYDGKDRCTWKSTHTHDGGAGLPPVRLTLVRATAAAPATTGDDTDAFARKAAIMQSPRWQRAVSELGRWLATLTYSPAAMLKAPASSPASPAKRMVALLGAAPAKPITRAVLETSPSLAPKTAARIEPDLSERCHDSPPATALREESRASTALVFSADVRICWKTSMCSRSSCDM